MNCHMLRLIAAAYWVRMPELPEVEITARRLSAALAGAEVESALATGVATLKTFDPPLDDLEGREIEGVGRIGKMLRVDFSGDLALLIHLMSAGRLQLYDKRASLKDKRSRLRVRIAHPDGDASCGCASSGPGNRLGRSCCPLTRSPRTRWSRRSALRRGRRRRWRGSRS